MPQHNDSLRVDIDLSDFGTQLDAAGQALSQFASGPARDAATELEQAFSRAGDSIERELKRVARTGQIDLGRLASGFAANLAEFAVGSVFGGGPSTPSSLAGGGPNPTVASALAPITNVTLNLAAGTRPDQVMGSVNQIAAAVAQAAIRGGRFL